MTKPNPIAKELRKDGKYAQRVEIDRTKYDRKRHKELGGCWTAPWPVDEDTDSLSSDRSDRSGEDDWS